MKKETFQLFSVFPKKRKILRITTSKSKGMTTSEQYNILSIVTTYVLRIHKTEQPHHNSPANFHHPRPATYIYIAQHKAWYTISLSHSKTGLHLSFASATYNSIYVLLSPTVLLMLITLPYNERMCFICNSYTLCCALWNFIKKIETLIGLTESTAIRIYHIYIFINTSFYDHRATVYVKQLSYSFIQIF